MKTSWLIWTALGILITADMALSRTLKKRADCDEDCDDDEPCDDCNICNESTCCSTRSCTSCVNRCSSRCGSRYSCRSRCIDSCADAHNCNNCSKSSRSKSCKNNQRCDNRCSNNCGSKDCGGDCEDISAEPVPERRRCTKNCKQRECSNDDCHLPIIDKSTEDRSAVIVEVPDIRLNTTNNNLINLTTHINVNNVIHNFHNISVPITVNTTNINNFNFTTINHHNAERFQPVPPIIIERNFTIHDKEKIIKDDKCCYILHPKNCFFEESGQKRCIQYRHRDCSENCVSRSIHRPVEEITQPSCHFVQNYPYVYCGNYQSTDCSQCTSSYSSCHNQNGCAQQQQPQPACPSVCRPMGGCAGPGPGCY